MPPRRKRDDAPGLFDPSEEERQKLRAAGWKEDNRTFLPGRHWVSPDGREVLSEEEAVKRVKREGGES